jgi:hypothetical protein
MALQIDEFYGIIWLPAGRDGVRTIMAGLTV